MAKTLTYEEFIEYAEKHYTKGGDGFVECWDKRMFEEYVEEFGPITKRKALDMFRLMYGIELDRQGWGW